MINIAITVFLCLGGGLLINITHSIFGKEWLKSFNQLLVATILPLIGFIITKVISTNFYLSLGMIGALSIVRFRTPIKSPYELMLYFSYITLGITAGVDWLYSLILIVLVCLVPYLLTFTKKIYPKFFKNSSYDKNYTKKFLQINGNFSINELNKLKAILDLT